MDDGRHGLSDAVDPGHQGVTRNDAHQHTGDQQDAAGDRQTVPETPLQGCEQAVVASDQQVAITEDGDMDQCSLHSLVAQVDAHAIIARCGRHGGPRSQIARQGPARRVGEQQHPVACNAHPHARIDEILQALDALPPEHVGQALCVGLQDFRPTLTNGSLPGIPQRGREQHQRKRSQGDAPQRE